MSILGKYVNLFVQVYIDDIVIYSNTDADHLVHVTKVMDELLKAGLSVSGPKCKFAVRKIDFLGFVITDKGIDSQPDKIQAIIDLKPPKNLKQIQMLLRNFMTTELRVAMFISYPSYVMFSILQY